MVVIKEVAGFVVGVFFCGNQDAYDDPTETSS